MKAVRPIRIDGDLAYITLTQGYVAVIDAADVPSVQGKNWCAKIDRRRDGSIRTVYAVRTQRPNNHELRMHRVLLGAPNDLEVDHKDGDGLNNRRYNLRLATVSENQRNRRLDLDNKSGIKGVCFNARLGKWRAYITHQGKNLHLGFFTFIDEAAAARSKASAELHGEFRRFG
jgi:hypothetical protein